MKDLTDEFKLSARSTPQVFLVLGTMINRLQTDRRVRFRGKKPTRAALVNAALLYLDSLPQAQWEQALQVGLTRLEGFLTEEGDIATSTPSINPSNVVTATDPPASKPAAKPKVKPIEAKRVGLTVEDVSPEVPAAKPTRTKKRG